MGSFPRSILLSRGYKIAHQPESNTIRSLFHYLLFMASCTRLCCWFSESTSSMSSSRLNFGYLICTQACCSRSLINSLPLVGETAGKLQTCNTHPILSRNGAGWSELRLRCNDTLFDNFQAQLSDFWCENWYQNWAAQQSAISRKKCPDPVNHKEEEGAIPSLWLPSRWVETPDEPNQ